MRTAVATVLALILIAAAAAPHVHAREPAAGGSDECTLCTVRHGAPPRTTLPHVAPVVHVECDAAAAPGLPPVCGSPLGAVPGQSPPHAW